MPLKDPCLDLAGLGVDVAAAATGENQDGTNQDGTNRSVIADDGRIKSGCAPDAPETHGLVWVGVRFQEAAR